MQNEPLLAYLAGRFVNQRENLATEALAYILGRSAAARSAVIRTFRALGADLPSDLTFRTQATGADQAIPDVVGEDAARNQHLILEAKFWAGLTSAQPVSYLRRLMAQGRGTLAFVAPAQRSEILWQEVVRRCQESEILLEDRATSGPGTRFASLHSASGGLALISWSQLLANILAEVELAGEQIIASDIRQLQGLCDREDADAFLPLAADELTNAGFARRITQFCDLVDDLANRLVGLEIADVKGLRGAAAKGRYGRYLRLHNVTSFLYFSSTLWSTKASTPIWLRAIGPTWTPDAAVREHVIHRASESQSEAFPSPDGVEIPIRLAVGEERDQVFEMALQQLLQAADWLKELGFSPIPTLEVPVSAEEPSELA